jgi:hypothetical protein
VTGLKPVVVSIGECNTITHSDERLGESHEVASVSLISSPTPSFSTDLSAGSLIDAPAEFGHPGSLSTCSLPPLGRIELHSTRTSFNLGIAERRAALQRLEAGEATPADFDLVGGRLGPGGADRRRAGAPRAWGTSRSTGRSAQ